MIYEHLFKPFLFRKDAEKAHDLALSFSSLTHRSPFLQELAHQIYGESDSGLEQTLWGLKFPNPVGLAAGFDKNGVTPLAMQALGFGFIEVGSITARPCSGNPKPRAFRLPADHSLINRMGLNNEGADVVTKRLKEIDLEIPLGINIAKTNDMRIHGDAAIMDYQYSYNKAIEVADYVTVNISCPNTGEGKTFEDPEALRDLLSALNPSGQITPTLVKFSVDTDQQTLEKLIAVCQDYMIDGYVATNTSSARAGLNTSAERLRAIGNGGLSGRAIAKQSTQIIQWIYEISEGARPIIGVGGIDSAEAALEKLKAGASLVQIYTGMIYKGPGLVADIKKGLKTLV